MITAQQGFATITLCIQDGLGANSEYRLCAESGVFIGKSANCGLQLQDQSLSDIHCRIGLEGGSLWVQDWMSAAGTLVNGIAIDSKSRVEWGDVIQIGRSQITASTGQVGLSACPDEHHRTTAKGDNDLDDQDLNPAAPSGDEHLPFCQSAEPPQQFAADDDAATNAIHESDSGFEFAFAFEEEETFDRETVALLRAEIDALQIALAQRDAECSFLSAEDQSFAPDSVLVADQGDEVLERLQELIEEANRSDERVAILEELLHAAEDTHRAEHEERNQLEGWVGDIERRIGQREDEHTAEIESLRQRLDESHTALSRLQRQLKDAAFSGGMPKQYEQSLEHLQHSNRQLQEQLVDAQKHRLALEQRLAELSTEQERSLREDRANIAQEQAKLARMRFELSKKLADVQELPKSASPADAETSHRIQALRDHLREIHELERKEEKEASLTMRLSKLWKRIEHGQNG